MPTKAREALAGVAQGAKERATVSKMFAGQQIDDLERRGEELAEDTFSGDTRTSRAAQEGTVLSVVTLGIIGVIGILIYSQVNQSLPNPENSDLNNSSNDVTSGFGDALGLLPVILIVLMAAVVLAIVQRFRQ